MFWLSDKFVGKATLVAAATASLFVVPLVLAAMFWSISVMAGAFRGMVAALIGG